MNSRPNTSASATDFEFAALSEAKNYRAALLRLFRDHLRGKVLEVGCGIGQMTEELLRQPTISELVSIEPDAGFCDKLRARLPAHPIVHGTIGDLPMEKAWNSIVSINVLEHIEQDSEELRSYHRLLQPSQGTLCLFVPSRPEIYSQIDRDFGHFRRYTKADLTAKLRSTGFEIKRIRYYNLIGYFLWFINFRLLKSRSFDVRAVRLFDRIIFPIAHGLETHICAPPIGQSLVVTALAK